MTAFIGRWAYAMLMAALLAVPLASVVSGWSAGTDCSTSTYRICVSYDDNNGLPRATTNLNDQDYWGDNYYNSITPINDTVSSLKNLLASPNDVLFYTGSGWSGTPLCVPSGTTINDLGWWGHDWDDQFSSHLIASAC